MHKKAILPFALMAGVICAIGTAGGADALPGATKKPTPGVQKVVTPEISAAGQRVQQAKAQVDIANKQLNASKALLVAARADLRAAETELEALQLKAEAQGLVDQTGMTPAIAAPVPIAAKPAVVEDEPIAAPTDTVPASAPVPQGDTRIRSNDAEPAAVTESPLIQLR
mgnify:CR=1 FL=1